jgi:hypothetical protein
MSPSTHARQLLRCALAALDRGDGASARIYLRQLREHRGGPAGDPWQYGRKGKRGGRWLRIGAGAGAPVYVEGDKITKGCPGLVGHSIEGLDEGSERGDPEPGEGRRFRISEEPEPTTHRQDMRRQRDWERARWRKRARAEGLDPDYLEYVAQDILTQDRHFGEQRRQLLRQARRELAHYGYDARALTANLRSGRVEDEIPALDVVADSCAHSFPDQFAGHDDWGRRLLELFVEGAPKPITEAAAYDQAFRMLRDYAQHQPAEAPADAGDAWEPPDDDFALAGAGSAAADDAVPFVRHWQPARYARALRRSAVAARARGDLAGAIIYMRQAIEHLRRS